MINTNSNNNNSSNGNSNSNNGDNNDSDNPANSPLPFMTADLPGTGGKIKLQDDDFFVEEIPLYEPCGSGDHLYIQIEKVHTSTPDMIQQISSCLRISRQKIGYAGLKDARAVSRQWISIEHANPEEILQMQLPRIRILQIRRHGNKLRMGHLRANRFVVRIGQLDIPAQQAADRAKAIMAVLTKRGAANYYGPQRFGKRHDTNIMGEKIIKQQKENFLDLFLGYPLDCDGSNIYAARQYYENQQYKEAHDCWPQNYYDQRRALRALIKGKTKTQAAVVVDNHLKRLFVSAFQSELFNKVLAMRMPNIDKIYDGDIAYKHDNGACFLVENAQDEQQRCDNFEISPTGPMFGSRMKVAQDRAAQIENEVLAATGLSADDFRELKLLKNRGGRRPLRFKPQNVSITPGRDQRGDYLEMEFELAPGCYATTLLREICKNDF